MTHRTRMAANKPKHVPPYLWWTLQDALSDPLPPGLQQKDKVAMQVHKDILVSCQLNQGPRRLVATDTPKVIYKGRQTLSQAVSSS